MDQDIHFQHRTAFAAGAATTYFQIPYRCTVREINAIVQADATWAADATYGDTVCAEGGFLKFVTSAASAANCDIDIELDPYAR
jgi:hypothetical protein